MANRDDDHSVDAFADEDGFESDDVELADSYDASCPHCGELVTLVLDPAGGAHQEYVEDCPVCCRPWTVTVELWEGEAFSVELSPSE